MVGITIPLPEGQTFESWLATLNQTELEFDVLPQTVYKSWQETADTLLASIVCRTANCPSPYTYNTWQEWVYALIQSFGGVR